jgi:serine/threonine protein kinase
MIGQTISQYRILAVIGEGSMGTVYAAVHVALGRPVAIKTLRLTREKHHYRARFLREARAAAALKHVNIATVYDYGETQEGVPFIVMERVDGPTLDELIQRGELTLHRSLEIIEGLASALTEAHGRGIIHRDVKPKNVAINERGEVKVLDFGLAKQLHDDAEPNIEGDDTQANIATQTSENVIVGTPMYLSPEQALGGVLDARSDLFSVGSVLYECITGRPSFPGNRAADVREKVIRNNPPPPSSLNPDVPAELDHVTLKALAKKTEDRYQSAKELLLDLGRVRETLADTGAMPVSPLGVKQSPTGSSLLNVFSDTLRKPRAIAGVFLVTLTLALFAVWITTARQNSSSNVPINKEAVSWYERGTEALREGTYQKAVNALQKAISIQGDFPLAHARLAEALTEIELTDRAKNELLTIDGQPSALAPLEALQLQAIRFSLTGDSKSAIETYKRIVDEAPEDRRAATSVDLGRAYERDGDSKRAIEAYLTALKYDPDYVAAAMRLGVLYARRQGPDNVEKALGYFKNAEAYYQILKDTEGLAEVSYHRGVIYVTQRELNTAEELLTLSLRKSEAGDNKYQQFRTRMQLSSVYCFRGDTAAAERYATEALEFAKANGLENSMASGLVTLGNAFLMEKKLDQARKHFERGLEVAQLYKASRSLARALLTLASLASAYHNRADETRAYVQRAIPLYQQDGSRKYLMQAHGLLGHASEQQGDYTVAHQSFMDQLQIALEVGDRDQESLAYEGLGIVYLDQEQYPKALENLDKHYQISSTILKIPAYVMHVQLHRAKVLFAIGDYAQARTALAESKTKVEEAKRSDNELLARQALVGAQLALTRRDFNAAIKEGRQALELSQNEFETVAVESLYTLGLAEVLSGRQNDGLRRCTEAHEAAKQLNSPALITTSLLTLAIAKLETGHANQALADALQARERFGRVGQKESEWRALLVAALAAKGLGDETATKDYAVLASQTLESFQQSLETNGSSAESYRRREDVQSDISKLSSLLKRGT